MTTEEKTPTALDVADAILSATGPIDQLMLHKLLYYVQGWHLAWYDEPVFDEELKAWPKGPTVWSVYRRSKVYRSDPIDEPLGGDPTCLDKDAQAVVAAVADAYKHYTGLQLMRATHDEAPWQNAREGLAWNEYSDRNVSLEDIKEHFRRSAEFGGHQGGASDVDPDTMERIRDGDMDAVVSALEAL